MKFFNSLTRKVEVFKPMTDGKVGLYTCGPTVYDFVTIGNWRTYVLGDLLNRVFRYLGNDVNYIMNITDVGHLTGDNLGDADLGEDRMEKAVKREGKSAWDIADFYTRDFLQGFKQLNCIEPGKFCKVTDHIKEQIELVVKIEAKKLTYKIEDGIYFDTKAYESVGNKYGELSTLDKIKAGARVETIPGKKDPRDFALWKFSPKDSKRQMEWDSPWGIGFPGWHIECSAISMKYLGEQFDVHVGGEDLRSTHHPNEIAQSEAATGKKPFVKYWVHGAFLLVDGGRMGKSLGNAYTLNDLVKKGFEPLDLRYFYLTGHYRKQLNFTFDALEAAKMARKKLNKLLNQYKSEEERLTLSDEKLQKVDTYRNKFKGLVADDFKIPEALAVVWEVIKSNIPGIDKYELLMDFDEVLGLDLASTSQIGSDEVTMGELSEEVINLINQREKMRKEEDYEQADKLRNEIKDKGYVLEDGESGVRVRRIN